MRADRLLSILLLLQIYRQLTARELAQRLEVSERTIYRDMDALSAAGVPVYAERGTGGGWFLPEEYRTSVTGLSEAEVRTLFLAAPPRLLADLGLQRVAETALVKLQAALPAATRRDAEYARQRLHIDMTGWKRAEEAVPQLQTIQEAVWQERRLQLRYRRGDGSSVERLVDPLGLVASGSTWYLVAAVDGAARSYRISRVQHARMADEPAARPAAFDLAAFWEQSKLAFKANLPRYPATLRVAPEMPGRISSAWRYARIEQADPPDASGWLCLQVLFETEEEACGYVLSAGPQVEVLQPAALRAQVIALARATLERYTG